MLAASSSILLTSDTDFEQQLRDDSVFSKHNFQILLTLNTLKYVRFDSDTLMNQEPPLLLTHLFRSFVFQTSELGIHSGTALVDWEHKKQQEGK